MSTQAPALAMAAILVLEDDYYLATDLEQALQAAGASVIGPFADECDATQALAEQKPSCALVDVNLGEGPSFEFPRQLHAAGVPFAFVTGYDASTILPEFAEVPRLEKPVGARRIVEAAVSLLRSNDLPR